MAPTEFAPAGAALLLAPARHGGWPGSEDEQGLDPLYQQKLRRTPSQDGMAVRAEALDDASAGSNHEEQSPLEYIQGAEDKVFAEANYGVIRTLEGFFAFIGNIFSGNPTWTTGVEPVRCHDREKGQVLVVDGIDDLASLLLGSGMPQSCEALINALITYPVFILPTKAGYDAARAELTDRCTAYRDNQRVLQDHMERCLSLLAALEPLQNSIHSAHELAQLPKRADVAVKQRLLRRKLRQDLTQFKKLVRQPAQAGASGASMRTKIQRLKLPDEQKKRLSDLVSAVTGEAEKGLAPASAVAYAKSLEEILQLQRQNVINACGVMCYGSVTAGLGSMCWALCLLEVGAIAEFFGGNMLADGLANAATGGLMAGQSMMGGYGLLTVLDGLRQSREYRDDIQLISDAYNAGQVSEKVRDALSAKLATLGWLQQVGRVGGGSVFTAGQGLMAYNSGAALAEAMRAGVSVAASSPVWPALIPGFLCTVGGIVANAVSEGVKTRLFGFDPDTLETITKREDLQLLSADGLDEKATNTLVYALQTGWEKRQQDLAILEIVSQIARLTGRRAGLSGEQQSPLVTDWSSLQQQIVGASFADGNWVRLRQHQQGLRGRVEAMIQSDTLQPLWQKLADPTLAHEDQLWLRMRLAHQLTLLDKDVLEHRDDPTTLSWTNDSDAGSLTAQMVQDLLTDLRVFQQTSTSGQKLAILAEFAKGKNPSAGSSSLPSSGGSLGKAPDFYQGVINHVIKRGFVVDWTQQEARKPYVTSDMRVRKPWLLELPFISDILRFCGIEHFGLWEHQVHIFQGDKFFQVSDDTLDANEAIRQLKQDFLDGLETGWFDALKEYRRSEMYAAETALLNVLKLQRGK